MRLTQDQEDAVQGEIHKFVLPCKQQGDINTKEANNIMSQVLDAVS